MQMVLITNNAWVSLGIVKLRRAVLPLTFMLLESTAAAICGAHVISFVC